MPYRAKYDRDSQTPEEALSYHYPSLDKSALVKITIRDLVAAIRKNGLPKGKNNFYDTDPTDNFRIIEACALGQAAINLDADPYKMANVLGEITKKPDASGITLSTILSDAIAYLNDGSDASLDDIADMVELNFDLDDEFYIVKNHFWEKFESHK